MQYSELIIGILMFMVIIMSINLSELKNQLYRTNKVLEKMASHLGVEELDFVNNENTLESVKDLVKEGKKIAAIKSIEVLQEKDKKEAKDKIDKFYETLKMQGEI